MSAYLLGVVGTVLFASMLILIMPDGKTSSVVKASVRLACLVVIVSPILIFFQTGRLFDLNFTNVSIETDADFIEYCSKINVEQAEKSLKKCLEDEFDINCDVVLIWKPTQVYEDKYEILKIRIVKAEIYGDFANMQATKVQEYVKKNFFCEVEIKNAKH